MQALKHAIAISINLSHPLDTEAPGQHEEFQLHLQDMFRDNGYANAFNDPQVGFSTSDGKDWQLLHVWYQDKWRKDLTRDRFQQ